MLVVGRRQGEGIRIGDDIEVVVVQISGGQVRLGVTAKADVKVLRSELQDEEEVKQ